MPLAAIDPAEAKALRWLRSPAKATEYRLLAGDQPVAQITWAAEGRSLAAVETADRRWTFKRAGFLSPQITARTSGSSGVVARLSAHIRHHTIDIAGGASYRLRRKSLLLPAWTLTSAAGEELLHVEPVPEHRHLVGGAVIVEGRRNPPEMMLLLCLSWYFIVLVWFEDEAAETLAPFEGPDPPIRSS